VTVLGAFGVTARAAHTLATNVEEIKAGVAPRGLAEVEHATSDEHRRRLARERDELAP